MVHNHAISFYIHPCAFFCAWSRFLEQISVSSSFSFFCADCDSYSFPKLVFRCKKRYFLIPFPIPVPLPFPLPLPFLALFHIQRQSYRSDQSPVCAVNNSTLKILVSYIFTNMKLADFNNIICKLYRNRPYIQIMQFNIHNIIYQLSGISGKLTFLFFRKTNRARKIRRLEKSLG